MKKVLYFSFLWGVGVPIALLDFIFISIRHLSMASGFRAAEGDLSMASELLRSLIEKGESDE